MARLKVPAVQGRKTRAGLEHRLFIPLGKKIPGHLTGPHNGSERRPRVPIPTLSHPYLGGSIRTAIQSLKNLS